MPLGLRIAIAVALGGVILFALLALWSQRAGALGLLDGRLRPCGSRPNCVVSEGSARIVPALPLPSGTDPMAQLVAAVERLPRTRVTARDGDYLRAESRTLLFRFVDDLELRLDPEARVAHVRSASRVGYSDRGENRRRVEALRRLLAEQS